MADKQRSSTSRTSPPDGTARRIILVLGEADEKRGRRQRYRRCSVRQLHRLLHVVVLHPRRARRNGNVAADSESAVVPRARLAERQRVDGLRRTRPLSDAEERPVFHLRAPPKDLPELRLPDLSCSRHRERRPGSHQSADPPLEIQLRDTRRSHRARRGADRREVPARTR